MSSSVWDPVNGIQSLQVLLTSLGVDLTGWQLSEATGVSADGNIIVGFGTNPNGAEEGFVADISVPEPSISLPLGLGVIGLFSRASRRRDFVGGLRDKNSERQATQNRGLTESV